MFFCKSAVYHPGAICKIITRSTNPKYYIIFEEIIQYFRKEIFVRQVSCMEFFILAKKWEILNISLYGKGALYGKKEKENKAY